MDSLVLAACVLIWACPLSRADDRTLPTVRSPADRAVTVTIKPTAVVSDADVCISDIAAVDGGTEQLRERIGRLDLAEPPRPGQTLRLTAQHVAVRIRIAGLDEHLFAVRGAREVRVTLASRDVTDSEIVSAAEKYVRSRLPWDAEDVTVQPVQPLPVRFSVPTKDDVRLEPELRSPRGAVGRVRVDVAIWADGRKHQEIPVLLDVRVFQKVAVATRRIERGQVLTDDNIYFDRRPLDGLSDFMTARDNPIGQRAKRTIAGSQVIATADVEPAQGENSTVVRSGDVVTLSARVGSLRVQATGEALQDGAPGKVIRVRNASSKAVVTGRIVDRSTIEVLR